jgi:uncharacterized protein (DUF1800 family)
MTIAQNRFGLGANGNAFAENADPKQWLLAQFDTYQIRPSSNFELGSGTEIAQRIEARQKAKAKEKRQQDPSPRLQNYDDLREIYFDNVNARADFALKSSAPFVERLVHFWSNHFAISVDKIQVRALAGAYEFEAIRPNVLGSFRDLLLKAVTHQAMVLYLDQARSIGPNSQLATRMTRTPAVAQNRRIGINENLAREIMELHTLGVHGGYNQTDVTEFAKALTGVTVMNERRAARSSSVRVGQTYFEASFHENGSRTIMGKTYRQNGMAQPLAIIEDLAKHPSTARNIATKLARHFAGDTPPVRLVNELAATFQATDGDLKSLYRVLVNAPECWVQTPLKYKTPWEWLISSLRATGFRDVTQIEVATIMRNLGHSVWEPKSPKGFDDIESAWAAPDALMRIVELAPQIASRVNISSPDAMAQVLLGQSLSAHTKTAISRAESPISGLSLLLVSPEFMRR